MSKSMTSTYIFFGICVLARWFLKEAFMYAFPLLIFYAFGFIVLVVLIIYFFIYGLRKVKEYKFKAVIPFIVSLATILFILFFPVQEFTLRLEFYCYKPIREKIVQEIKESNHEYIKNDDVELPWYVSYASADGTICVSKDWNNVEVGFLFYDGGDLFGKGRVVYSTTKLEENKHRNYEEDAIVKKLGDNWYYIEVY